MDGYTLEASTDSAAGEVAARLSRPDVMLTVSRHASLAEARLAAHERVRNCRGVGLGTMRIVCPDGARVLVEDNQ